MTDEDRQAVKQLLLAAAVVGLQVLAFDQRAQITLRAWVGRVRKAFADYRSVRDGTEATVSEWIIREHYPKVIGEAERLTRDGDV